MPPYTSALDDESSETSIDAPRSLREYIKNTVINTVPPLIAYYGLRLFGVTPYLALVGAIVVATAQGLLTMVRKRKFEPLNGLVIVAAACSLTIAFTTKNPRMVQVVELLPVSLLVWSLTASGLLRRPTSLKIAGAIVPTARHADAPMLMPRPSPVSVSGSFVSSSSLTATRQYLMGFLNPVSSSMVITWAVITPCTSWPTCSTASTSRPACVRRRPTSRASYGSGIGAYSRSQEIGTRISLQISIPKALLNRTSPS